MWWGQEKKGFLFSSSTESGSAVVLSGLEMRRLGSRLSRVVLCCACGALYWLHSDPVDGKRNVISQLTVVCCWLTSSELIHSLSDCHWCKQSWTLWGTGVQCEGFWKCHHRPLLPRTVQYIVRGACWYPVGLSCIIGVKLHTLYNT